MIIECDSKIDYKRGNKFSVLPSMAKIFDETSFKSSNSEV